MPKVAGYGRRVQEDPLKPALAQAPTDTRSLAAAINANLPDKTALEANKTISDAMIRGQGRALGVQESANKLAEAQGAAAIELKQGEAKLKSEEGRLVADQAYLKAQTQRGMAFASRTAAQAMESGGQILVGLSARLQKLQDDKDNADMFSAIDEWRGYANSYWNDPNKGVKNNRLLNNASGLYEETRGFTNELTERVSKGLRTDEMRMKFRQMVAGHSESLEKDASVWETRQLDAYNKNVLEKTLNTSIAGIIANPTPESFAANFEIAQQAVVESMRGADEPSIQMAVDALKSQMHTELIAAYMEKDPIKAEQYFYAVQNEILPQDAAKLEPKLNKASMVIKGQNIAEEMLAKFGPENLADAQQEIRDNFQGEEEERYLRAVNGRFSDAQQAARVLEAKQSDAMIVKIKKRIGGYQALNSEIEKLTGVDEITKIQLHETLDSEYKVGKYSSGGSSGGSSSGGYATRTDPATWHKVEDLIDSGEILKTAPDWPTFRAMFKGGLSPSILQEYGRRLYKNADGSDASDPAVKLQESTLLKDMLKKEKIEDAAIQGRVFDRYNYEIGEAEKKAKEKGFTLSYEDRVKVMQGVLAPVVVGKTRNWHGKPVPMTKRRFDVPPEAKYRDGLWYFPDVSGKWIPLVFQDD